MLKKDSGFTITIFFKYKFELSFYFIFSTENSQQCGNHFYPMTDGLIAGALGNYKSEWDGPSLPEVPDYDEIMIWDNGPGKDQHISFTRFLCRKNL